MSRKWIGFAVLLCFVFLLICGAVGLAWYHYIGPDPKNALAAVSRVIGPDPKNTVVSSDSSKWEIELGPAIKRLPDDEKRLVGAYLVRRKMAEAFGVKDFGTDGMTVGQMIDAERAFEKEQANKESEAKALKEKVTAEKEAIQRQIDDILTVALISKSFRKADYKSGTISDESRWKLPSRTRARRTSRGSKERRCSRYVR